MPHPKLLQPVAGPPPQPEHDVASDVQVPPSPRPSEGSVFSAPPPEPTNLGTQPAEEAPSVASSSEAGDPEQQHDVQAEVAQLQGVVNDCVRKALKGCPCTFLERGERASAFYFVDEALQILTVTSSQSSSQVEVSCPIVSIQDIFCVSEDGESAFPPSVIMPLTPEEKDRLLMVVFRPNQGQAVKFCLLLESRDGRDAFMEAMRVLCVASRFAAEPPPPTPRLAMAPAAVKAPVRGADRHVGAAARPRPHPVAGGQLPPGQQVSVGFFMRSLGVKALQPTGGDPTSPLPAPSLLRQGVVPYLSAYGYRLADAKSWEVCDGPDERPKLSIRVRQHIEAAKHTWYIVESTLVLDGQGRPPRLDWLAPRRLAHLRHYLHEPVREALGPAYPRHFGGAGFARRLGLPGTTANLHRWCSALAACINSRSAPPIVAALALHFLEAPSVGEAPGDEEGEA